jgi:ABC-2 type transport system ATP-binding protein
MSDSVSPVLEVEQVTMSYGRVKAVDDVSLGVRSGAIVGLLGPNGAGKTTLIRCCAGWLRPEAGLVRIEGEVQSATNLRARAHLGVVSRDAPLAPELTVRETLHLRATLYGLAGKQRKERCTAAIEEYCLSEFANKRVGALSTGMLQRTAVACAMLHEPSLLLLDEPTVGLDPEVRQHIWHCLRGLAARGVAMLFTTHYLEEAAILCSEIHLMCQGRISLSRDNDGVHASAAELEREYLQIVGAHAAEGPQA